MSDLGKPYINFFKAEKRASFMMKYGRAIFTTIFGVAAFCFFPPAISVSGAFAGGLIPCFWLAVLSFIFVPIIASHRRESIISKYGAEIIKPIVNEVREQLHKTGSLYNYYYENVFYGYLEKGYFKGYCFADYESFLNSIESNKNYNLKKEICDAHTKKCKEELKKAIERTRDVSSKDVVTLIDSLVSVNNKFGIYDPLDKEKIVKDAERTIGYLKVQDIENEKRKRRLEEERIHDEELRRLRQEESRRRRLLETPKTTYSKRNYASHCWNCGTHIDGSWNRKCPKCGEFFICPNCGYCKCHYNIKNSLK